jgi:hypothetical protein
MGDREGEVGVGDRAGDAEGEGAVDAASVRDRERHVGARLGDGGVELGGAEGDNSEAEHGEKQVAGLHDL